MQLSENGGQSAMQLSDKGLAFIARWEGYRRFPYNDAAGYATIGYGHLLHYSPVNAADRARYPFGLTQAQALKLLRKDCLAAQRSVQQLVGTSVSQHQFDALVSFAFNCGGGALAHSTLLTNVRGKAGSAIVTADFCRWNHAGGVVVPGLIARRQQEATMFCRGVYS